MIFKGTVVTDFITEDEKNLCLDFLNSCNEDMWESVGGYWDKRVMFLNKIKDVDTKISKLLIRIRDKQKTFIEENITMGNPVYSNGLGFVRWFEGNSQGPHADKPGGFDHREFGSILYLNDNYEGGEIYYPEYGITIKPTSRAWAIHPGDLDHMHGVTEVKGSMRYTVPIFWTYDRGFADGSN